MAAWPVRLIVDVHSVTGAGREEILNMPLRLAYSFQHCYYEGLGLICTAQK